jgi:hypothetical protein
VDPTAQNPRAVCIKLSASLLNPTSPAPALRFPPCRATLHCLHSPPHRAAAPYHVTPALHSLSCCTAAPPSPLPTVPRRRTSPHHTRTPLPTAPRRCSPPHRAATPHRVTPALHSPPCHAVAAGSGHRTSSSSADSVPPPCTSLSHCRAPH